MNILSYTVQSSEKTRKSGAEGETKALLYLMNFRSDSNEIHYFVVDFFNDLTCMDRYSNKLWDLQSKAAKNNSPKAIGKELVTLYKNYISDFSFAHYILFVGGVSTTVCIDSTKHTFTISNITADAQTKIVAGLKEEAAAKEYIDNKFITDQNISDFLSKVLFVIDDKEATAFCDVNNYVIHHLLLKHQQKDADPAFLMNSRVHLYLETIYKRISQR